MSNKVGRKADVNLETKSTIPVKGSTPAVKERGLKFSGPRAKGYGKLLSKDAGPQQYKKPGKKSAKQSGPREYKKG